MIQKNKERKCENLYGGYLSVSIRETTQNYEELHVIDKHTRKEKIIILNISH